jgi:threonine synthase
VKLASTRSPEMVVTFRDAIFQGLAPDGGLYQPVTCPDLSPVFNKLNPSSTFLETATAVTAELLGDELSLAQIESLCKKAFPFSPEIKKAENHISILELFHGPSCAFKDFGASFLATSMELFLADESRRAIILTATSGDTGSAVAQAFKGTDLIDVVILYPSGRVSPLQEKQLTTVGGNVHALEVEGSFDDCQAMVKKAFVDEPLNKVLPLTSANSINIGRLMPQAFYYVFGRSRYDKSDSVRMCVPSGNFGNLTAGVLAWKWGMITDGFIAATNVNDVVPEYLTTSVYTPKPSIQTYSNAMDVGDPSNFERLLSMFDNDADEMRKVISGEVVTDAETSRVIGEMWRKHGILLDPHTAVGYCAAERYLADSADEPELLVMATAHPAKFSEIVEKTIGSPPELPGRLAAYLDKEKVSTVIGNDVEELKTYLLETVR